MKKLKLAPLESDADRKPFRLGRNSVRKFEAILSQVVIIFSADLPLAPSKGVSHRERTSDSGAHMQADKGRSQGTMRKEFSGRTVSIGACDG